jgi:5,10-methylenetetrahydromethanopterin reductase
MASAVDPLPELGFYGLAGHATDPASLLTEARDGEAMGLGTCFISERFNVKDAPTLCGAVAGATTELGIATAATNHNTRHPLVTATFGASMHTISHGRFALGLGRGFDALFQVMGLAPVTGAQLTDVVDILRTLWRDESVIGHSGPAGNYPFLHQGAGLDGPIPIMLVAIGPKTLELAGRICDGVVLHTFFADDTLERAVASVRKGAEEAGKDPASVRVWSVLATVGDHLPEDVRLRKIVGRMATYLQGYGDILVQVNGWDPAVLEAFRKADIVTSARGAIDATATTEELEQIAGLIPDEWLAASATGTPEQCAATVAAQFDHGADSVVLHGATPADLAPVVDAYRAIRPAGVGDRCARNPGWFNT